MRTLKNLFLFAMISFMASTAFAQGTVKGVVVEAGTDMPLPGANIIIVGTDTGTTADFDGNFVIEVPAGKQTIKISYLGYDTKVIVVEVPEGQTKDLGKVSLSPDTESLNEVVIVGVADIAKDRQTPVAVSTMKAAEIEERIGTKELPEVLNYTPSVYATKQGGGFGDARINIRGFDQRNTAVMINGMPVNDMENGWVYWSNWAGLADVTSAMQVQRGLGASKLAIPSVGGTINILTNSADKKKGGSVAATFGNDNYMKFSASYNTGLMENGLSASFLLSHFSGDGYVDATEGDGYTWFFSLGYKVNDNHSLMFTATGAPQWHHQRSYAPALRDYIKYGGENGEPNIRYNADWGWLHGEVYSMRRNFYHKPIASLNWEWKINDASKLSTVLYGSWGRGGGTGDIGRIDGKKIYYTDYVTGQPYFRNEQGTYMLDEIYAWNSGQAPYTYNGVNAPLRTPDSDGYFTNDRDNGITRRASMNSHDWYGIIMNYHNDVNENLSLDAGIDGRTYSGYHYRVVNDVLGADRYYDNRDINNPNRYIYPEDFVEAEPSWNPFVDIKDQEKIEYYNQGNVRWFGGFGQIEYKTEVYSAFVQGGISNQQFQRIDYFNYLDSDPEQTSDWVSMNGGNIKGGFNYNINEKHNVFVNAGYYSKQPLFRAVFPNYNNNDVNEDLKNETVQAIEMGYGFKNEHWKLKLNGYLTSWKDRFAEVSAMLDHDNNPATPEIRGTARLYGIQEIQKGIEMESRAKYGPVKIYGMMSVGDWYYDGNVTAPFVDDNNDPIPGQTKTLYLDGVKVGDAAQFTARYGVNYNPVKGLFLDVNQFYVDKLYAKIDPVAFSNPDHKGSLQLPSYSLVDASITYKFDIERLGKVTTRFSVNNLFDKKYISESATNIFAEPGDQTWNGVNTANRVFFGWGRSWNFSVKLRF